MMNRLNIEKNLQELERHYDNAHEPRDHLFYSKLALLELCGWIEESMDEIVLDCARKHLADSKYLNFVREDIVDLTSSFDYKRFREMLMRVVGIIWIERLEKTLDPKKFATMRSTLGTLRRQRDSAAHTHISGTTLTVDAPSLIKAHFDRVYAGLDDIERCVMQLTP